RLLRDLRDLRGVVFVIFVAALRALRGGRSAVVDADGAQPALLDLGDIEVDGKHVAGPGGRGQAAEIVDGTHGVTVDLQDDVAALDLRVECRAHRLHPGDDDAFEVRRETQA